MSKIASLTEAQKAKFPSYVAEWKSYGLSTEPADRPRAEAAIRLMYANAGLPEPRIVWTQSPLGNALALQVMKKGASVGDSVWTSVRASVGASVRASVWDSVGDSVWDSVYGQHDAHWLAFYEFFAAECGLRDQTAAIAGLIELCKSAGWALPYRNVCFVSERHEVCRLDGNNRIHGENGPAIRYPDGFAIYAWHGTRIPPEWMDDRASLTPAKALGWANIEQRRAACEIIGWNRILSELDAKTIDKDSDPEIGELLEVNLPDSGRERFLKVRCGTKRQFALPVPPTMRTAIEAQAWTYGYDTPSTFTKPEIRT